MAQWRVRPFSQSQTLSLPCICYNKRDLSCLFRGGKVKSYNSEHFPFPIFFYLCYNGKFPIVVDITVPDTVFMCGLHYGLKQPEMQRFLREIMEHLKP